MTEHPITFLPAAWLWEYIGSDPYPRHFSPIARTVREMDPSNPPYPDRWRPVAPLYAPSMDASSGPERLTVQQINDLPEHRENFIYSSCSNPDEIQLDGYFTRHELRQLAVSIPTPPTERD